MKCTLNPDSGIKNISGKCGGVLYKTFNKPDGTKETRAYLLPRKDNGKFGYERKSKPSKNELEARAKFAQATNRFFHLTDEQKVEYTKQWKRDKFMFNGKEYRTFRGYTIARLYAGNLV